MTALELERLEGEQCLRCGVLGDHETNLCETCRADLNARVRVSLASSRSEARANDPPLCVDCWQPSATYRCRTCRPPVLVSTIDNGIALR